MVRFVDDEQIEPVPEGLQVVERAREGRSTTNPRAFESSHEDSAAA